MSSSVLSPPERQATSTDSYSGKPSETPKLQAGSQPLRQPAPPGRSPNDRGP
jgi:hypothetical protein